jgi:hypothetical protein
MEGEVSVIARSVLCDEAISTPARRLLRRLSTAPRNDIEKDKANDTENGKGNDTETVQACLYALQTLLVKDNCLFQP